MSLAPLPSASRPEGDRHGPCGRSTTRSRPHGAQRRFRPTGVAAAILVLTGGTAFAGGGLPTGGQVTAGSATLQQSGSVLTVQQQSARLVTQW